MSLYRQKYKKKIRKRSCFEFGRLGIDIETKKEKRKKKKKVRLIRRGNKILSSTLLKSCYTHWPVEFKSVSFVFVNI